jgi:hypothetical protein
VLRVSARKCRVTVRVCITHHRPQPENFDKLLYSEKRAWYLAQRLAVKTNAELHSLRCDTMLKLQVNACVRVQVGVIAALRRSPTS